MIPHHYYENSHQCPTCTQRTRTKDKSCFSCREKQHKLLYKREYRKNRNKPRKKKKRKTDTKLENFYQSKERLARIDLYMQRAERNTKIGDTKSIFTE